MFWVFLFLLIDVRAETMEKTIILHGNEDLAKVLEQAMPKRCYKDGKDYAEGEEFTGGHLRYRCQKYGVYVIEGCRTDKGKEMDVGDRVVEDNLLSQCFKEGNSVLFRQTVCGIMGMPDCDKITPKTKLFNVEESASQKGELTVKTSPTKPTKKGLGKNRFKNSNLQNQHLPTTKFPQTKPKPNFQKNSNEDDCRNGLAPRQDHKNPSIKSDIRNLFNKPDSRSVTKEIFKIPKNSAQKSVSLPKNRSTKARNEPWKIKETSKSKEQSSQSTQKTHNPSTTTKISRKFITPRSKAIRTTTTTSTAAPGKSAKKNSVKSSPRNLKEYLEARRGKGNIGLVSTTSRALLNKKLSKVSQPSQHHTDKIILVSKNSRAPSANRKKFSNSRINEPISKEDSVNPKKVPKSFPRNLKEQLNGSRVPSANRLLKSSLSQTANPTSTASSTKRSFNPTTHEPISQDDSVDPKKTINNHPRNLKEYLNRQKSGALTSPVKSTAHFSPKTTKIAKSPASCERNLDEKPKHFFPKVKKETPLLGVAGMQEVGSVSRTISTQLSNPSNLQDSPGLPNGWHILSESRGRIPMQNVHLVSRTLMFRQP